MLADNQFNQIAMQQCHELFAAARSTFHRQVLVLEGNKEWNKQYCEIFTHLLAKKNIAEVSPDNTSVTNYYNSNPNQVIGKEHDLLIYHFDGNLDANLFAVCAGTVKGTGVFVISVPKDFFSTNMHDYFFMRLHKKLQQAISFHRISENSFSTLKIVTNTSIPTKVDDSQQQQAIEMIKHVVSGHRRRPLVLLADRGRGKSAALGIATAKLVQLKLTNIIITAPSFACTAVTFKHIKQELPDHTQHGKSIISGASSINFVAPDELIEKLPKTELLLIDEAAAIPTPMLEKLLTHYSRIVFSTTLHGYEGSGKGFELRFFNKLDQLAPGWKKYKLTQPIRWATNDALENFVDTLFLLNTELTDIEGHHEFKLEHCEIKKLSPAMLTDNEPLLIQLFSLLALAHYRTKPSDLKLLLTHPDDQLYIVLYNNTVVATAFCLIEGNISAELAEQIYMGNRRPSGNLVPQSLIYHCGIKEAAALRCLRITRIATHPQLRNRGIATHLLNTIAIRAQTDGIDYLGTSFGATAKLIKFWKNLQFDCFRIGLKKEASSNSHALMMIKPLNNKAQLICESARNIFTESFYLLLSDELRYLGADIIYMLMRHCINKSSDVLTQKDLLDLQSFALQNRSYDSCIAALTKFVKSPTPTDNLFLLEPFVMKVLQKREWQEVSQHLDLSGKQAVIKHMKSALATYLHFQQINSCIND